MVLDDCVHDEMNVDMHGTVLAPAELRNLSRIENDLKMISCYPNGRDSLAKFIMSKDYLHKLVSLVGIAEDLESLEDLHLLCNIVKAILLLNDSSIIDRAVSDDCILGVMGALEYDPEFPKHKANHRAWLANRGRFREVVPIEDAVIQKKIHQSYRLQYLKDVALARILDDPTFGVLNSLIFYTQVDIIQHIQSNTAFLGKLFGILAEPDPDMGRRKDAVGFIQQCCVIAKTLQPHQRAVLYNNFLVNGLFRVIQFAIRHPDVSVRVGGTDILMAIIEHDVSLVRQAMYRQIAEKQPPFTSALSDLLIIEFDLGVKSQVSDALKILLDPGPMMRANGNGEQAGPQLRSGSFEPQQDLLIQRFYEDAAVKLCKPLADLEEQDPLILSTQQASMFTYLVDLFSFFVRVHHDRGVEFLEQNNVILRVARLLKCREKYMQLGMLVNLCDSGLVMCCPC
jgi:protein phosphatase-4 regulatory subunit 3